MTGLLLPLPWDPGIGSRAGSVLNREDRPAPAYTSILPGKNRCNRAGRQPELHNGLDQMFAG